MNCRLFSVAAMITAAMCSLTAFSNKNEFRITTSVKELPVSSEIATTDPVKTQSIVKSPDQDREGYPIFYIRGSFNNWSCSRDLAFRRTGDKYTLYVANLEGEFKISASEWTINIGAKTRGEVVNEGTESLECLPDGQNIKADNLHNIRLSFSYNKGTGFTNPTILTIEHNASPDTQDPPTPWEAGEEISGTLPVIYINVYKTDESGNYIYDEDNKRVYDEEIGAYDLNHKNYFKGEYWIDVNGCEWMQQQGAKSLGSIDEPLSLQIKARGNYTRTAFPKKPFKIKLDKKQDLLGLTPAKNKHYALLAHADDGCGFMRNFAGFNIGRRLGLSSTPKQQPVEMVLNGKYWGLYFLTESVRVGKDRVDIAELDDNCADPTLCSGGYIVELDNYDEPEENQIKMEEMSCAPGYFLDTLRITFNAPEEYSDLQRTFIKESFEQMNEAVGANSDALWSYIDLDDAVRFYIARELTSDVEAFHGSTYMYRDRGNHQKWHFSPIWDCGNAFNGPTDDYFYNHGPYGNTWIPSFRQNAKFNSKVVETWKWFISNNYETLFQDLEEYADHISVAAKCDYTRWKNSPTPLQGVVDNSDMPGRLSFVTARLKTKAEWLKNKWGRPNGMEAEPERDSTVGYELPDYLSSGIADISDEADIRSCVKYFDIFGTPISQPIKGQLIIRVQGTKATKIIW